MRKDLRTALYARVSSEQQAGDSTIASQLAALEARVSQDGLAVLPEHRFADDGYSGATLIRPALERLRDLAASGAVDRVYVHSPDRLARRYAYQVLLVDELRRAGVEIVEEQARVVRQIFDWIGRERASIGEVCRRLRQQGCPTRGGRLVWDRRTIWSMLRNPAYVGEAAFGKTRGGHPLARPRPIRGSSEQPRRAQGRYGVPEADWISVPVPRLVDPALFEAVREQLAENRRRSRRSARGARYLFAKPAAQFGQGSVRTRRHLGPDRIVKLEQFWQHVAPLRASRYLAYVPPPAEGFRYVGGADTQRVGDLANSVPGVVQRKHPLAQILRIRLATPPLHPNPPAKTNRSASNQNSTPIASCFPVLVSLKML